MPGVNEKRNPGALSVGHRWALAGVALALILTGCARPPEPEGPSIESRDDLLAALADAGRTVSESALLAARGELAFGRAYFIDGARLEVFEYDSAGARDGALDAWLRGEGAAAAEDGLVVWARGRLVVVLAEADGGSIALLSGLLGDPLTLALDVVVEPYPPGVVAALGFLADELGVDPGTIVVVDFEAVDWPDACLGLGGPDEACAQVVTPGWRIELRVADTTHVLRSDALGLVIRRE
jgi:hypothetical protein